MVAAALRLVLQRRSAGSPSLALLRPLFSGPHSKPPSPLLAAAAIDGLPTARRSQFSSAPAPPLLRLYSSKGCWFRRPQQQIGRKETRSLKQDEQWNRTLTHVETQFLTGLLLEIKKQTDVVAEALDTWEKANRLLDEGLYDKAFAMFEKGLGDILKAVAVYEKRVDDYAKAIEICTRLPLSSQQQFQMLFKNAERHFKSLRQTADTLSGNMETMKILKLHSNGVWRPDDILRRLIEGIFAVGLGVCLLLLLTSTWIYLLSKFV